MPREPDILQQPRERFAFGALLAFLLLVALGVAVWTMAPAGRKYDVVITPPALSVKPPPAPPTAAPAAPVKAPSARPTPESAKPAPPATQPKPSPGPGT